MSARTIRSPFYAAGLTAILAAAAAGCASSSSGTSAAGPSASSSASGANPGSASPAAAVRLAAKTVGGANSFAGTMSLQATANSGASGASGNRNVSMNATIAEQLHPSLQAEIQIGTLSAGGSALPGGLDEIITPSNLYMKWSFLTKELHTSKPWVVIPVSALSKGTGVNLSQLFSQATNSSPLNESQLLSGASGVRKVGTSTIDGVAVTEYTGTISLDKGMQYLSGASKAAMQKEIAAAGLSTATFTVWIDGQNVMRKAVINESGTTVTEHITFTITSINQPVNISVPAAGQTSTLPSSALGSAG